MPGGGTYTGTIAARAVGETVELAWDTSAGRYFGIGLPERGAWYVACGEDGDGLGLAVVGGRGDLRWTPAPERGTVGSSHLVPVPGPSGELTWDAGRAAGAGFPFTGLALEGAEEVHIAGLAGGPVPRGLALPTAVGWAVAWYPRFDQTVILRYLPGREPGTWVALWGLGGCPDLAVELLRPAG